MNRSKWKWDFWKGGTPREEKTTMEHELTFEDIITNPSWEYDEARSKKHGKPILTTTVKGLEYGVWNPWWVEIPKNSTFWYADNELSIVSAITHKDEAPSGAEVGLCVFNK